ncbi:hypothetical protein VV089_21440 [Candidatus Merdisoma sp. JLR.KK011]|uniref:hypothetical protein n=1 Tax=Candidatus Merdisoma sp. JLR.KK011 TaxID=3114299 RepID=UPI002FF27B2C
MLIVRWGRTAAAESALRLFHILCSDGSRTGCLLWMDIAFAFCRRLLDFELCPSSSDSLYANSRTLDIGNAGGPIPPQPVF